MLIKAFLSTEIYKIHVYSQKNILHIFRYFYKFLENSQKIRYSMSAFALAEEITILLISSVIDGDALTVPALSFHLFV
jgi:hypothetical protein